MGKIILLNGPPSSGKDTAARHIRELYNLLSFTDDIGDNHYLKNINKRCILDRMSMPIKRAFAGTMGLPITDDGIVEPWESRKEEIIPEFGISYRQWQIDFSESFLKCYRQEIFGELLAARIACRFQKNIANLIVIPDCGFSIEIDVIYHTFGHENILLVRCHRPGFTFQGDSRSYVRAPKGCAFAAGGGTTVEQHQKWIEEVVKTWLKEPEKMPREE